MLHRPRPFDRHTVGPRPDREGSPWLAAVACVVTAFLLYLASLTWGVDDEIIDGSFGAARRTSARVANRLRIGL